MIVQIPLDLPEVYQMLSSLDGDGGTPSTYPENGGGPYHGDSGIMNGELSATVGSNELRDDDDFTYAQALLSYTRTGSGFSDYRSVTDGMDAAVFTGGSIPDFAAFTSDYVINSITFNLRTDNDIVGPFSGVSVFLHRVTDRDAYFPDGSHYDASWPHDEATVIDTTGVASPTWVTASLEFQTSWQNEPVDGDVDPGGRLLFLQTLFARGTAGEGGEAPLINRLGFLPQGGSTPEGVGDTNAYTTRFYEAYIEVDYTPPGVTGIAGSLGGARVRFS